MTAVPAVLSNKKRKIKDKSKKIKVKKPDMFNAKGAVGAKVRTGIFVH